MLRGGCCRCISLPKGLSRSEQHRQLVCSAKKTCSRDRCTCRLGTHEQRSILKEMTLSESTDVFHVHGQGVIPCPSNELEVEQKRDHVRASGRARTVAEHLSESAGERGTPHVLLVRVACRPGRDSTLTHIINNKTRRLAAGRSTKKKRNKHSPRGPTSIVFSPRTVTPHSHCLDRRGAFVCQVRIQLLFSRQSAHSFWPHLCFWSFLRAPLAGRIFAASASLPSQTRR